LVGKVSRGFFRQKKRKKEKEQNQNAFSLVINSF
jgi:hypothetical protein